MRVVVVDRRVDRAFRVLCQGRPRGEAHGRHDVAQGVVTVLRDGSQRIDREAQLVLRIVRKACALEVDQRARRAVAVAECAQPSEYLLLVDPWRVRRVGCRDPRLGDVPIIAPRFDEVANNVVAALAHRPAGVAVGLQHEALPPDRIVDVLHLAVVRTCHGVHGRFDGRPVEVGQRTDGTRVLRRLEHSTQRVILLLDHLVYARAQHPDIVDHLVQRVIGNSRGTIFGPVGNRVYCSVDRSFVESVQCHRRCIGGAAHHSAERVEVVCADLVLALTCFRCDRL